MRKSCSRLRLEQLLLLECSVVARFANFSKDPCYRSVIKKFAHAFSCAYIGFWMHLGSLESTQKVRVALGCASSYSYAFFVLSKLPACIHDSIYAR